MHRSRVIQIIAVWLTSAALAVSPSAGQEALRQPSRIDVLFIGNSYTYYNNLPSMLQSMAAAGPDSVTIRVASVVEGGANLETHWNQRTIELIRRGDWDYVVLQEQSLAPLDARDQFMTFGKQFANEIRAANAKPVLYLTWSRQQRPSDQGRLNQAYTDLARETGALLVPVGQVWRELSGVDGVPILYAEDGSHPSVAGSFVAASTFYRVLIGSLPLNDSGVKHGLNPEAVRLIGRAIERAIAASARQ